MENTDCPTEKPTVETPEAPSIGLPFDDTYAYKTVYAHEIEAELNLGWEIIAQYYEPEMVTHTWVEQRPDENGYLTTLHHEQAVSVPQPRFVLRRKREHPYIPYEQKYDREYKARWKLEQTCTRFERELVETTNKLEHAVRANSELGLNNTKIISSLREKESELYKLSAKLTFIKNAIGSMAYDDIMERFVDL